MPARAHPDGGGTLAAQLDAIEHSGGRGSVRVARGQRLEVTSLDKVYFPADGLTKGDVMRYYATIARFILPTLAGRPLVLRRSPDGLAGATFVQQRASDDVPSGVRVEAIPDAAGVSARRVVGGSIATLLYTVQLGCISIDPWLTRLPSLDVADYAVLDLDPGPQATFADVARVASRLGERLTALGLHGAAKTTGSRGVHLFVPLPARATFATSLALAGVLAGWAARRWPREATVERALAARPPGAVYVDTLQNMRGKSVAGVYSARARPGATVSTPVMWAELAADLDPRAFTIRTVPLRVAQHGDLWRALARRNPAAAVREALGRPVSD